VCNAVTNLIVDDAAKVTTVPVSAVAAKATDVPDVIWFAAGTATAAGVDAVVAFTTPAAVTESGAAFADVASAVAANNDATTIDSFFMLFFYSSSYDLVFLCVSLTHLTIVPKKALSVKFSLANFRQ
jgi:hypothetical protein